MATRMREGWSLLQADDEPEATARWSANYENPTGWEEDVERRYERLQAELTTLRSTNAQLRHTNKELVASIESLMVRITALEARLAMPPELVLCDCKRYMITREAALADLHSTHTWTRCTR